ncbi:hypothetical protein Q3H58_005304 [Pseudomonas psychrotolerans]|nr:hypothetical protein [Pseudomonas psychrotolerans]
MARSYRDIRTPSSTKESVKANACRSPGNRIAKKCEGVRDACRDLPSKSQR